uniref:Uncharacterized protein n=1 Tax=Pristionchus pacificus TaxID=54126 RepID=A0A2A6CVS6_PRIPA|eukprot:PDM82332.1 hypothetical protein PRIPAC_36725 [Pristionchus pacificus]
MRRDGRRRRGNPAIVRTSRGEFVNDAPRLNCHEITTTDGVHRYASPRRIRRHFGVQQSSRVVVLHHQSACGYSPMLVRLKNNHSVLCKVAAILHG